MIRCDKCGEWHLSERSICHCQPFDVWIGEDFGDDEPMTVYHQCFEDPPDNLTMELVARKAVDQYDEERNYIDSSVEVMVKYGEKQAFFNVRGEVQVEYYAEEADQGNTVFATPEQVAKQQHSEGD